MPLDRDHVTAASRIMLPTYAAAFVVLGLIFIFQNGERTATPAFAFAKTMLPMHWWGVVFAAVGVLQFGAMVRHDRAWYLKSMIVSCALAAFWTFLIFASAVVNPASFSSGVWPAVVTIAFIASAKSIALREQSMTIRTEPK